jgi:7-cyano-7-deazaguanine synthase
MTTGAVLLSGGLDSTALTAWRRPSLGIFVDYGQRPAQGELRAAHAVSNELKVPLHVIQVQCNDLGSGLLAGSAPVPGAPTPEWWPFRNQLLVTVAAAWAIDKGVGELLLGSVATDGERHADGRPEFYRVIDELVSSQEGGIHVAAPGIGMTTAQLITAAGIPDEMLAWTHSCHSSSLACGTCPGCEKRRSVLQELGRLS